eukprot:TRINITY_DN44116_c0_g1_i2.p2 TRINITY_DN44116_c0_g1~~TRINITY_DN44116_c0_g1_i2.p2  ORF type:complete len:193 (-),score=37.41 TRINITY_DN44116_c0_g1_i2:242-820(-)
MVAWGCPTLYEKVDQQNLQLMLSAILLEEQVVLVSSSPHNVSACAVALGYLISPLRIAGVHFPVLPLPKLQAMLDAPVPYLAGVVRPGSGKLDIPEGVVIVDLDRRGASENGFGENGFGELWCDEREWPQPSGGNPRRIETVSWCIGAAIWDLISMAERGIESDGPPQSFIGKLKQTQMLAYYLDNRDVVVI